MEGWACRKQDLSEMEFVRAEGASMRLIVFEYAVIHAKFSAPANQVSDFPQRDLNEAARAADAAREALGAVVACPLR
jgi:hypothetical protein